MGISPFLYSDREIRGLVTLDPGVLICEGTSGEVGEPTQTFNGLGTAINRVE